MTNAADDQYLSVLNNLLYHGNHRVGRNGGVSSLFGLQLSFDLTQGFPLLTTKKMHTKSIVAELLWFLRGDTNIRGLHKDDVHIWDEWADANGELGPVYGSQWRHWDGGLDPLSQLGLPRHIDQIANVIKSLKNDPFGRRHIVTAWNPAEIDQMALPPCHMMFQFYVRGGKHREGGDEFDTLFLDCQMYQRSADWFLGVPFNIASYALLTHLIAREVGGMVPGKFVHTFGDYHLYDNHRGAAQLHLTQAQWATEPWPEYPPSPRLLITDSPRDIFSLGLGDISFLDYNPLPAIKAEVSK